jgi:hypothetical protein
MSVSVRKLLTDCADDRGTSTVGTRTRALNFRSKIAFVSLWAAASLAAGCDGGAPEPTNSVQFQLDFGDGVTLTSVNYTLSGPNGFTRVGMLSVADQPSITTTFNNLPAGNGYSLTVIGSASDDLESCTGQATFNVSSSMSATITVALTCSGRADVTANINICPVIDALEAIPSDVTVGNTIHVTTQTHDSDNGPSPLTAMWQVSSGTLSNTSLAGATFTCTVPGTFTVSAVISDGDCSSDSASINIVCTSN